LKVADLVRRGKGKRQTRISNKRVPIALRRGLLTDQEEDTSNCAEREWKAEKKNKGAYDSPGNTVLLLSLG